MRVVYGGYCKKKYGEENFSYSKLWGNKFVPFEE
jgi:hypothetical protein